MLIILEEMMIMMEEFGIVFLSAVSDRIIIAKELNVLSHEICLHPN